MERYSELTKPFILNDLKMQRLLHDRRKVYDLLQVITTTMNTERERELYLGIECVTMTQGGLKCTADDDGNRWWWW